MSAGKGMAAAYDAVVIGGGHNGLVAAHYLAAAGLSVAVLERRDQVGGICAPQEFFPGYRGAITNSPGSLEPRILADMELERFGLAFDRPDPAVLVPFDGERAFVGWRDRERSRASLAQFSEKDAVAYGELMSYYQAFADRLAVSLFEPPRSLAEVLIRLTTPRDEADFLAIMVGSIRDLLEERFESVEVPAILAMLSSASGNMGPSTPGSAIGLLMRPLSLASSAAVDENDPRRQPMRGSTGLPRGGMGAVPLAMAASLKAHGVDVITHADVTEVITADGRTRGVVLADGREVRASVVLSNLHPRTTMLDLVSPGEIPGDLRARLDGNRPAGAAFKVVLALDALPRFAAAPADQAAAYAGCQFRIGPSMDYLDEGYEDFRRGRWSRRPQLWGLTPSVMDPTLAPEGHHLMSVNAWFAPYRLADGDWASERESFARQCIETLTEYIPNLPDIIVDSRAFSPVDLEREFGLLEGHQLHGDMNLAGMFTHRPVPGLAEYRTPVAGLYLCGAGSWPGGFVTGLPGHNASQQVLRDLRSADGESASTTAGSVL
jgi:phytoene dehydrogenase-like protein